MNMLRAPKARSCCSSCLRRVLGAVCGCLRSWLGCNHVKHDSFAALFEYAEAVRNCTGRHVVVTGDHHASYAAPVHVQTMHQTHSHMDRLSNIQMANQMSWQ